MLGAWSRIEGYPCDPNPNDPLARVTSESLFNEKGKLNPSITILGVSLQQFLLFCCSIQWDGFAESNNCCPRFMPSDCSHLMSMCSIEHVHGYIMLICVTLERIQL